MNIEKKEVSAKGGFISLDYAKNDYKQPGEVKVKKGNKISSVSRQVIRKILNPKFNKKIKVVFTITDFY